MEIFVVVWIVLALMVGFAANARGRGPIAWFFLAVILSPLIAIIFLIAFPAVRADDRLQSNDPGFRTDGIYTGIPYRIVDGGRVEALTSSGKLIFRDMKSFTAAVDADRRDS